ncbi:MAG: hypothetical protein WAX44_02215 [Minisyncoccia bacterium]
MLQTAGYISGILSAISYIPYIRDILKLKTKPERASWLIWSVLGSVAFFSQFAKGADHSLWLTGVQTFGVLIVFLLSIKFGYGGLNKLDIFSLIGAGVGLFLWYITNEPAIALFIVIVIDAIGGILTVIKSYKEPESETTITWVLSGIAGIFAAIAVGSTNIILLSYPIYIFIINFSVVLSIFIGFKKMNTKKNS